MSWKTGDRIRHRFNPDLGPGLVLSIEGRTLVVRFPDTETSLRFAADSDAIEPLRMRPGDRAMIVESEESVVVAEHAPDGQVRLADGRQLDAGALWPLQVAEPLVERLVRGEIDPLDAFSLRLDALHLAAIREADGLGSFLGGRIRLFPHQLYAAERATRADPVRWLLADEVGLGKTVEACLVLNHLLQTGRADRALVVAPETLTVQWLGELWRKYHQVFALLDEPRLQDVERVYGAGFNPFEAHPRAVVGLEFLRDRPWLTEAAVEAGIDLLIVDEAHHLRRPPGHPGSPEYRAVRPIAAAGKHVLLLTATPLEEDAFGFFRLLQLLRPEEFPEDRLIAERLDRGDPLPPCTSATRRVDVGGLPPRQSVAVDLGTDPGWKDHDELEQWIEGLPAPDAAARRRKLRRMRRCLASGAALEALLGPHDKAAEELAKRAASRDPRIDWLVEQAPAWRQAGDRTLVFAAHRETLDAIRNAMSQRAHMRVGIFHEDLSPGQRDIEVAQFRLPSGPSMLVSTECGGEGRNFEFCTRLVLFDLPWNPMAVEQRIGRLDRIGREIPVEIVFFRPHSALGRAVADLYDELGLFRRPMAGLERELSGVEAAIEELALSGGDGGTDLREVTRLADRAYERIQEAAQHELHRDPYRPEMAESILARIPEELEDLMREVVLSFAEVADLKVDEHRGGTRYSIELGHRSLVHGLPGVPAGSDFLGTFDREEALRDESSDFFASGHVLVEGVMAHMEDSPIGTVSLLHLSKRDESGLGLLAIYKNGPQFEAVAVDTDGRRRPDWAALLTQRPLRSRRVKPESWTSRPGWADLVRGLAVHLDDREQPVAIALFRFD